MNATKNSVNGRSMIGCNPPYGQYRPTRKKGWMFEWRIPYNGSRSKAMHRTLDEIRREGLEALKQRLGQAGMIRFLQQFEAGSGDYATERHDWVDRTSLADPKKTAVPEAEAD